MYQIIKVNRYFKGGAKVTSERTLRSDAELNEVMALAKQQGADVDEVVEELNEYGYSHFKGYSIYEM